MDRSGQYRLCGELHLRICTDQYGDYSYYSHSNHLNTYGLHDRYITVSVSDNPPWNFESPLNSGCYCGVAISILAIISKELNYRFRLIQATPPLKKITTSYNVSYEGAPADVLLGNTLMSLCPLAANPARVRDFELTTGYIMRDYLISVHKTRWVDSSLTTQPILTTLVWNSLRELWPGMLVAAFGLTCVTLVTKYITKRLQLARGRTHSSPNRSEPTGEAKRESVWERVIPLGKDLAQIGFKLTESFFKQCKEYRPGRFHGTNVAGLIWLVYGLVTSTIMNARLSSSLTGSEMVPPFASVAEFVASDFYPLLQVGTVQFDLMNSSGLRAMLPKVRRYDSGSSVGKFADYAVSVSQTGKVALITVDETPVFIENGFIPAIRADIISFISVFQLRHGSPFAQNITKLMFRLARSGTLKHFVDIHKTLGYAAQKVPMKSQLPTGQNNNNTPIKAVVLASALTLTFAMFFVSVVFFIFELVLRTKSRLRR